MAFKEKEIKVEPIYEKNEYGIKLIKYKSITDHKIYKIKATYGGRSIGVYYVRAYNAKQAKDRFYDILSYLKIVEIEETDLQDEDLSPYKCIVF